MDLMIKLEALFRLLALFTLALSAILMATDFQTKIFFGVYKKTANFKLAHIFILSVYVQSIGAGYNLVQLIRCLSFNKYQGDKLTWSDHILKWTQFLLDQMAVYMTFAINCAAIEIGILAISGVQDLQWLKLCNKYTKFCFQLGGSLACGMVASILLFVISGISTFNLFRWYSPNFLCLKPKRIGIIANS